MAERTVVSRRSPDIALQGVGLHRLSRVVKNHWKLAISGVATVGVLSIPPSQFTNKVDAIGAAVGIGTISCADAVQPAHHVYAADELVLLGTGNRRDRTQRTYAALDDLIAGTAPVLFVDDGPNDGLKTQLHEIKEIYRRKTHKQLPDRALIFAGTAVDTADNMRLLTRTIAARGDRVAAIVTNAGHENRATMDACQDGVASFPLPAEKTLQVHDPEKLKSTERHRMVNKFVSFMKERVGLLKTVIVPGSG